MKNLYVFSENRVKVHKRLVHKLVTLLKEELKFELTELQFIFVNSEYIHEVNKEFLNHDYSTDIITFNYSEKSDDFDAEVYISVEDAMANAKKYKATFNSEIIRLIIHGILHLLGYDDIKKGDQLKMKKIENTLVKKYEHFDKQNIIVI